MNSASSIFRTPGLFLVLLALVLGGCARQDGRPTRAPFPGARTVHETAAKERPGLGTAGAEHRVSWVEPAYFARAWKDRPSAVEKLFYNDREGVEAMFDYFGGGESRSVPGLQPAARGLVRLGLRDGSGRWFEALELRKQRFAIGERGARYEVVLKNETARRLEVVVSVDGLDTFDGEPASVRKRGYVLAPRETVTVDGFRTGEGSVSAFRFVNVGETYAARRHGATGNVGVIGVAVFPERMLGTPTDQYRAEHRAWRRVEAKAPPSAHTHLATTDA